MKYIVEIKGITHDWIPAADPVDKKTAEAIMAKAIKAGRKATHIRISVVK